MQRIVTGATMSVFLVSLAAISSADTLMMRDGTRVEGTVVSMAARTITFRHADGMLRRYPTNQVEAVRFVSAERANPRAVDPRRLEAPAATELMVRTVETIDSRTASADQNFSAIAERDVTNAAGNVIVPVGASVQLVIRAMSSSGASGSPEMALDIQSITVDGRKYAVNTADLSLESDAGIARNKRTAEAVGGGASLGTVIGAVASGGKDAAIGGIVSAAGGASAQVLTRGRGVRVPPDTLLTFRLDKPVTLQPAP